MTWRQRAARWALKSLAGDRMTADQLVTAVFGPGASGPRLGSRELLLAYDTMPWLRAVIGRISWQSAIVPWQLFVATGEPQKVAKAGQRVAKAVVRRDIARSMDPTHRIRAYKALRADDSLREITDHPALQLLDRGNERMAGPIVRQVTQQHLDLVGEGAWLLERNGFALPTAILPIPPTWIAQTPWDPMNGSGLTGNVTPGNWLIHSNRGTLSVPKGDVIYFYHPRPVDPYDRGTGTAHALGDELETDEYTAKHLKRWFKNFAIPPLIISRDAGTGNSGSNVERLEEAWMRKLQGKNGVPFFSSQKLDVKEINQTFQDMQLSQLRKDERDILIHVYGMPPEIFGILENSNRSTIDAADFLMAKYLTVPRLEFMRITLQQQLIERYDERLILDYVSPILEDKEFELKVMTAAPGDFMIDEIRTMAGRRPLADGVGEGFMVGINQTYIRTLDEAMAPDPVPPPTPTVVVPPVAE